MSVVVLIVERTLLKDLLLLPSRQVGRREITASETRDESEEIADLLYRAAYMLAPRFCQEQERFQGGLT